MMMKLLFNLRWSQNLHWSQLMRKKIKDTLEYNFYCQGQSKLSPRAMKKRKDGFRSIRDLILLSKARV